MWAQAATTDNDDLVVTAQSGKVKGKGSFKRCIMQSGSGQEAFGCEKADYIATQYAKT